MKLSKLLPDAKDTSMADLDIAGVTCDSRTVRKDYAFVCINGVAQDGHQYAQKALESGASVLICERDLGYENQIIVKDTRKTYSLMCAGYFGNPARKLRLIGVTGTNGKTTTTNFIKSVLEQQGHKVGLIGTVHNMVGKDVLPAKSTTPDAFELHSLFEIMVKAGCEYAVMEVSSHAIDQDRIYGLNFSVGVFTNLTQDHLDYHKTMENYLAVKKRLFTMCQKAVVNADDPYAQEIIKACDGEVLTYSVNDGTASYSAENIRHHASGVDFEMVGNGVIGRVKMKTPGDFTVYNALAAGVACIASGEPFASVVESLSAAPPVKGRAEVVPTGRDFTVIIDYAHTPDGLKNIIQTLNQIKTGRLIVVFGCGGNRDKGKRPQMGSIAAELSDSYIVTSDNPRNEDPNAIIADILDGCKSFKTPCRVIEDRREAIRYAVMHAQKDDIILLAGKGHETYQIVKEGTIHLDEREIVAEVLTDMQGEEE